MVAKIGWDTPYRVMEKRISAFLMKISQLRRERRVNRGRVIVSSFHAGMRKSDLEKVKMRFRRDERSGELDEMGVKRRGFRSKASGGDWEISAEVERREEQEGERKEEM